MVRKPHFLSVNRMCSLFASGKCFLGGEDTSQSRSTSGGFFFFFFKPFSVSRCAPDPERHLEHVQSGMGTQDATPVPCASHVPEPCVVSGSLLVRSPRCALLPAAACAGSPLLWKRAGCCSVCVSGPELPETRLYASRSERMCALLLGEQLPGVDLQVNRCSVLEEFAKWLFTGPGSILPSVRVPSGCSVFWPVLVFA